jgi:hypothetical protein
VHLHLVNLKRSKSAPGLIEASCRLPCHAPLRRTGSGIHRLSSIKEADVKMSLARATPVDVSSSIEQVKPIVSHSSNSLRAVAPLASSVSFTSSLTSSTILANEIEYLKRCLVELEHDNPSFERKYQQIQQRLKLLQQQTS